MKPLLKPVIAVALGLSALLLILLMAVLFIPDRAVLQAAQQALEPHGLTLQAQKLGTSFPFSLTARQLTLSDSAGPWITVDKLRIRLQLTPLLTGKIRLSLSGQQGAGSLSGAFTIYPLKQRSGDLQISNLELASIPLIRTKLGGQLQGAAKLEVNFPPQSTGALTGAAKLQIKSLGLKGASVAGMALPDITVPETRGMFKIAGQDITIESLAMQGDGIYLRLSGKLATTPTAPLNLSLELMPTPDFMERQKTVFMLMMFYQTTPGSYRLPISGTLASPQLASKK